MISSKRFLRIILIISVLGCIFLIYNINESRPASVQTLNVPAMEREFTETTQVGEGENPMIKSAVMFRMQKGIDHFYRMVSVFFGV